MGVVMMILCRSGVESAVDEFDAPAGHFADVVAAFAHAPPVGVGGGPAVAMASDVINMPKRGIAERVGAALVAQLDQVREPAVEAAPCWIPAHDRAAAALHG